MNYTEIYEAISAKIEIHTELSIYDRMIFRNIIYEAIIEKMNEEINSINVVNFK